ncbi:MAG: dihydroneopterin triphosphate diphosphatase [Aquabacterium sp.]|uniref:dihydroneopterin triphosphate diphosphatase n=1 Tax=Aquabacterium sp. TaxID=1872578 RepID=UPI0011FF3A7C|nr:dihydroneopterin triphosphate diphosphatase [Aquabacterium sp.]TAK93228.1 MAG: dihydroneopterin triphosphate diphosphatase [Aquabacterium sp.]
MLETPHKIPQSVLVVIYTPELDVLLIERAKQPGFWQSVTGSKDTLDEAWAETAVREVQEETGIVIGSPAVPEDALCDWSVENIYEIYPVWRARYAPGVTHNTERVFGLCVPQGTPVTLAPREHTQYAWLPWREAADRCFSPSNAEAILQLAQRIAPADASVPGQTAEQKGKAPA